MTSHLANARDISTAHQGIVPGMYVRSDAPQDDDEAPPGIAWPPATVVDLRDEGEKRGPHALAALADVHAVHVFEDAAVERLAADAANASLAELYSQMIAPPHSFAFAKAVRLIATAPTPVLVHCSAGKDRAGVTAALVLSLLGAPREAVVADYVKTADNMPAVLERFLAGLPPEMVAGLTAAGADTPHTELLDAPAAAIEAVLDTWAAHGGGVEGWYLANGGDAQTLQALRERLVV